MVGKVHAAHVAWARTNTEFSDILHQCGVVAAIMGVVTGSAEIVFYRLFK